MELPKTFAEFSEAKKNGFLKVKEYKENGGKLAGVLCTFCPDEVLIAAGIETIGLCGTSNETVADAEKVLPKNLCPMVKSTYGFALTDKCPYTYFSDIIVGETTCDGKKKMYELLGEIKDTYVLHLPQGKEHELEKEFWYQQVKLFKEVIEKKFQVQITNEKLREAAKMTNQYKQAMIDLFQLQMSRPPMSKGVELMYASMQGAYNIDRRLRIESIQEKVRKIKDAYESGERPVSESAKRIMITGSPMGEAFEKIGPMIEANGGVVVCYDNCAGESTMRNMIDIDAEDILREIADNHLHANCSVLTPNESRLRATEELIDTYRVDGVIEVVLQFCHTYNIESVKVERAVKAKGIPYLKIETDYSTSDTGQISTRINAFLEML